MARILRGIRYTLFLLVAFAVLGGCGTQIVTPMEYGAAVPESDGMEKKQVADAILRAGMGRRWQITPVSDGVMEGVLNYKGQTVPVTITYNAHGYTIRYTGGAGTLQSRYNRWIGNLDARIRKELLRETRSR